MRFGSAFVLALALPVSVALAGGGRGGAGSVPHGNSSPFPLANALGGNFASRGMARPLGGIAGPTTPHLDYGHNNGRRFDNNRNNAVLALPYAYSYYIPSYSDVFGSDYYGSQGYYPPAEAAAQAASQAAPGQPVVINQYFAAPPQRPNAPVSYQNPQHPGDPIGPVDNYYLIAYKNHSVYPALAYWLEDGTLHYVTTENTHNQASLDLIDLNLTKTLNQARSVPFSLPGQYQANQ